MGLGVVHDILGLEIPMHDFSSMGGMYGGTNLCDDDRRLFAGQRGVDLGVFLEQLAGSPFDGEKMKTGIGFPDLDSSHDVWMNDTCAVLRFANEARNGGTVMPKLLSENLESYGAVDRMLSSVHRRCTALSNLTLNCVPGYL